MQTDETVTVPVQYLCSNCRDHSLSYAAFRKSEERGEREERLFKGTREDVIKEAWSRGRHEWYDNQTLMHVMWLPPMRASVGCVSMEETVACGKLDFERHVYKYPTHTVTRVSCEGITVEETIRYAD